jgi:hypothetical protein
MTTDDDKRIRQGLKFLVKADSAVIRAALPLEILEEVPDPLGVGQLLERVHFTVERRRYRGRMSKQQYDYLSGKTGSLKEFADAIAKVLIGIDAQVVQALGDLSAALGAPAAMRRGAVVDGDGIGVPVTGCCTYDTNLQKEKVSQSFCLGGLQGTWQQGPCTGIPPSARKKPARRGAR